MITLLPFPEDQVRSNDPDGVYFNERKAFNDGQVQLLIVGPMVQAPANYEKTLYVHTGGSYRLIETSILKAPPGPLREQVMRRGFISLRFERLK